MEEEKRQKRERSGRMKAREKEILGEVQERGQKVFWKKKKRKGRFWKSWKMKKKVKKKKMSTSGKEGGEQKKMWKSRKVWGKREGKNCKKRSCFKERKDERWEGGSEKGDVR